MSLRERYFELAGSKRLVIKNPLSLARVDMLKIMFPEAFFVFALRAPWPTIRSATRKGNESYIVPTKLVSQLPRDNVLRAAATWAESVDTLINARDEKWILIRYEDLVANPYTITLNLYRHIGIKEDPTDTGAAFLPRPRERDFSRIKFDMMRNPHRQEIFALLASRAQEFGYSANLSDYPGNSLRGGLYTWLNWLRRSKKSLPAAVTIPSLRQFITSRIERQNSAAA
jgi:hypothetical protein